MAKIGMLEAIASLSKLLNCEYKTFFDYKVSKDDDTTIRVENKASEGYFCGTDIKNIVKWCDKNDCASMYMANGIFFIDL